MSSVSELRNMVGQYVLGEIDSTSFQEWFVTASLGGFSEVEGTALANRIEGLLAEGSHASWPEPDIREELANAIHPFVQSPQKGNAHPISWKSFGDPLRCPAITPPQFVSRASAG
jgi:hypothetical protein